MRLLNQEERETLEIVVTENGFDVFITDPDPAYKDKKICVLTATDFKNTGVIKYGNSDFKRIETLLNVEKMTLQFVKLDS